MSFMPLYLSYIDHVLRKWLFRVMILRKLYISQTVGITGTSLKDIRETVNKNHSSHLAIWVKLFRGNQALAKELEVKVLARDF